MKKNIKDLIILASLVLVFFLVLYIKNNYIHYNRVDGESMLPTLIDKDLVVVLWPSAVDIAKIPRGKIVIFKHQDKQDTKVKFLIKRIIGLPGEEVIIKDWEVYIKNQEWTFRLEEDYISSPHNTEYYDIDRFKVPDNAYFVLGDNRPISSDSRECFRNCIDNDGVFYLPFNDITWVFHRRLDLPFKERIVENE